MLFRRLALVMLAAVALVPAGAPRALADVHTISQDAMRTGWDKAEPALSPGTVTSSTFGQVFATKVNGQVYAQPLVIGNTVVVGTEDNWVYGLDAATGAIRWQRSLGPFWPASANGCGDLVPNLGNTSTGVYDPATNTYYLTSKVNDGPDAQHPNWYLNAIDVSTGASRAGWPVKIVGTPANDPAHPFVPFDVNQRAGLLLMNGTVYMAFGSHCDYGFYVGVVAGVNTTTQAISMWSDEVGASSKWAGIWQGGGGIVSDGPGRIFVSTGNGVTPPDGPGGNPPQQLSQSVIRLGVAADGTISAQDFFAPFNAANLDLHDQDLGSGGPVALPSQYFGTSAVPNLMVEIGKEGKLYVLDRDHLGGKNQKPGGGDGVVQVLGPYQGVWGHPAAYGGEGGYLYVVQNSNTMLAFKYGQDGSGRPAFSLVGNSAESFGYTSGSPIVTSNGTTPGSAVVWVVNVDGPNGANGRLCAYQAVPVNNHLNLLRCFPIGTGVKFTTPASSNGRVYVGTRDGYVYGFGQPTTAALATTQTSFGDVDVSTSATRTVTATATRTVTVNAVGTTGAPFTAGTPDRPLPATLTAGDKITVPVTFAPTGPGSITGALNFTVLEAGVPQTLGASLQGNAIKPGLSAAPAQVKFGELAVGTTKTLTVSLTNTGRSDETVISSSGPAAPFTVAGLPGAGTVVHPGQTVAASVTYAPTAAGSHSSSLTVTGQQGNVTVVLAGTAATGHPELSITPAALTFGSVPIGASVTKKLTVSNTGNLAVTITKAAPPALPFVVNTPLPEGLVLNPEDSVEVAVTFAPTSPGSFSNPYLISSNDGSGLHSVPITGTAAGLPGGTPLPPVAQGGWFLNGSAQLAGTDVVLTPNAQRQTGSAVYSAPLPSNGLQASFTARIGGGGGADGMTFALLNAAGNSPQSLGGGGGNLGFGGLPGLAVTLDTYQNPGDPSANFLGLSTGAGDGSLAYLATATNIPDLRQGSHGVVVSVNGTTVTVFVDGAQRLSAAVPDLPPSVLPAFTAATGGVSDQHVVGNVAVTSGSTTLAPPGSGWRFNGTATMTGPQVVLTPAARNQAGTVVYSDPVATDGLTASFNLSMTGGTGADGATFALLDPAQAAPTSVGAAGGGLGFSGLAGVAVCFVTYPQSGINSNNFVGIATSTAGGGSTFLASTTAVPDLRASAHDVVVAVTGTTVTVAVDGVQVLSTPAPSVKPTALAGFTAGTGVVTDVHAITDAQVVTGRRAMPVPAAGGWTLNGPARLNGGALQLTTTDRGQTSTAVYSTPVPTANLHATFTSVIGGGSGGADGLTFMLLDATKAATTSIGGGGGGLGFAGLPGVAVGLDTYRNPGDPSGNFVGVSTGGTAASMYASYSTAVPNLRTGTHEIDVSVSGGRLVVRVDGAPVSDTAVAVPATALVGFSGATGAATDAHVVRDLHISY